MSDIHTTVKPPNAPQESWSTRKIEKVFNT